jgi:hypothetical protein
MADRPILFSAPMIDALLAGRKTQTRRLCRPANEAHLTHIVQIDVPSKPGWFGDEEGDVLFFSGYAPGDRLWVREAWRTHKAYDDLKPTDMGGEEAIWPELDRDNCDYHGRYRHGRFMPRWASRLTLIVTDVRVERLQDCSESDAWAEGLARHPVADAAFIVVGDRSFAADSATYCYRQLWEHINGEGSWAENPWVVALSFDVRMGNIDNLDAARG